MTTAQVAWEQVSATNVVDRDRGRFDESGVVEGQAGGKRDRVGADVPEALQGARKVSAHPESDGRRARGRLGRPDRCRPRSAARP